MKMRMVFLVGAVLTAASAWAGDPTQPPAAAMLDGGVTDEANAFRLQSVLLPQQGKPVAVIGGRMVPLGGKVGEARLVRLNEYEAVLQGTDGGLTRLFLTPAVDKYNVAGKPPGVTAGKTPVREDR